MGTGLMLQALNLIFAPMTVHAISWSMGAFNSPPFFRRSAQELDLRVTEVCRSSKAAYGAKTSLHKRCLAMDLGKETSTAKIIRLRDYGLCATYHKKSYFRATADHWHATSCSTPESRAAAREDQRARVLEIRSRIRSSIRPPTDSASSPAPKEEIRVRRLHPDPAGSRREHKDKGGTGGTSR